MHFRRPPRRLCSPGPSEAQARNPERKGPLLRLSKKVDYALIALKDMSEQESGTLTSARAIAERRKLPRQLLAKLLQSLKSAGVVGSVKGMAGGYCLTADLGDYSLYDLIEALEGPQGIAQCVSSGLGEACELVGECPMVLPMTALNRRVLEVFKRTTLAELFAEGLTPADQLFSQQSTGAVAEIEATEHPDSSS